MKKKRNLIFIPVAIVILLVILVLVDEFIIKPKKMKQLKQNVTVVCIDIYKSAIDYYQFTNNELPPTINSVIPKLKEAGSDTSSIETCLQRDPIEYQRRLNGSGYKLTYKDAWGKEQVEEVDFDTDYEQ